MPVAVSISISMVAASATRTAVSTFSPIVMVTAPKEGGEENKKAGFFVSSSSLSLPFATVLIV